MWGGRIFKRNIVEHRLTDTFEKWSSMILWTLCLVSNALTNAFVQSKPKHITFKNLLSKPWWHHSADMELELEQFGWTMSGVLAQNQDWPHVYEMRMGLTTVHILKMWLFTAELLQVMPQVETIFVTILLSLVSRLLWEGGEKKSLYTLFVHAQLYWDF